MKVHENWFLGKPQIVYVYRLYQETLNRDNFESGWIYYNSFKQEAYYPNYGVGNYIRVRKMQDTAFPKWEAEHYSTMSDETMVVPFVSSELQAVQAIAQGLYGLDAVISYPSELIDEYAREVRERV